MSNGKKRARAKTPEKGTKPTKPKSERSPGSTDGKTATRRNGGEPESGKADANEARRTGRHTHPVLLRTVDDKEYPLATSGFLHLMKIAWAAVSWRQMLRNRLRWKDSDSAEEELRTRARDQLAGLGLTDQGRGEIAAAGAVEVSLGGPDTDRTPNWQFRLPWEYMLAAATKDKRANRSLTVVRHLPSGQPVSHKPRPGDLRVLIVVSAPDPFGKTYSFESEQRLVGRSLGFTGEDPNLEVIDTPTKADLREAVNRFRPDVIHVTGVDAREGAPLVKARGTASKEEQDEDGESAKQASDGLYILGDDGDPVVLPEAELVDILVRGAGHPPSLIAFNFFNSAGVAGMAVGSGAAAAIGFQDEVDNVLAESFFADLYRVWTRSDIETPFAFHCAWQKLRGQSSSLKGSGLVLWSDRSLADIDRDFGKQMVDRKSLPREVEVPPAEPEAEAAAAAEAAPEELEVEPIFYDELNYALLHNKAQMFQSFNLRKFVDRPVHGIEITVVLDVGATQFRYEANHTLTRSPEDFAERICVPLNWEFVRTIRETVRSTVFVEVRHRDRVLYRNTERIDLLPLEAWRDNEHDGIWLPSFVFPRDPAVGEIVRHASRYLKALADDGNAGFDGYQSWNPQAYDPAEGVDLQVRALWSTIVHERDLAYINPPPAYAKSTQRLRSPSQIAQMNAGTCIDLTLLLAACLEYVDIYPVIFLFRGHACVGYWRSQESYSRFVAQHEVLALEGFLDGDDVGEEPAGEEVNRISEKLSNLLQSGTGSNQAAYEWISEAESYGEVLKFVMKDELVPLETVALTQRKGFARAVEEGIENLRWEADFDAMLDLKSARDQNVTPMPIMGGKL